MERNSKVIIILLLVIAVLIYLFADMQGYIPQTEPELHKYPEEVLACVWL